MEARVTLNKWGNGAGFLVPKKIRREIGLNIGDEADVEVEGGRMVITPAHKRPTLHSLMEGYEGPAPEFIDPGKSTGREIW